MADNKNVLLAVVLSLIVLLGWHYFVSGPQLEKRQAQLDAQRAAQEAAQATQQNQGTAPPAPTAPTPPQESGGVAAPNTNAATAAAEPAVSRRVPVKTDSVEGSINLAGARIDDLHLLKYRVSVDPESDTVILLSPSGSAAPYYAEFGWTASGNAGLKLPGPATVWTAPEGAELTQNAPVELTWNNGEGLVFKRTISIDDAYMFTVVQSVENETGAAVTLYPYGLISRHGKPEISGFFILHEGLIGVFGEDGLQEVDYDDVVETGKVTHEPVPEGWVGITDKYWATALIPPSDTSFRPTFSSGTAGPVTTYQSDFLGEGVTIEPGSSTEVTSRLFAGAKEVNQIDAYEETFGIDRFELMIDWGWFYFITKPLFFAIDWLYGIFGNFGVAILAVTVVLKLIFFPLANKSYKSMTMMKKVQPQVNEIRERYKDDKQKQQQMMMELYKEEKINPLSGCLPILIQIPVFFALYKVLFVTIDMRHAPFFGWIQDLSAPDPTSLFNLFGLIPWTPPELLMLGIWPLIMGVTMFVQMKMNPAPTDPTQAMIFNWMPVLFTFMLASFPAGLVIYWAWNNFLSILQQGVIMRRYGVKIELFDNLKSMVSKGAKKPAE